MMGLRHYQVHQWACMHISLLFNNTDCASPAPIHGGAAFRQETGRNYHSHFLSPSILSGECTQVRMGPIKITVKVAQKCYTPYAFICNGHEAGFTSSLTFALRVEERCQSDKN